MKRRIILVDLHWTRDKDPRVPLGHASLLASLALEPSVETRSIVRAVNAQPVAIEDLADEILGHARGLPPDAVDIGIGAYVWAEHIIVQLLPLLRARGFRGRLILGGPQISYAGPGIAKAYPEADVLVRGYGEQVLRELVRSPERVRVPGACWAGDIDTCTQASVEFAELPSPWLTETIPLAGQRFVRWETQRGCPFRCAFCQHREPGARLRRRSFDGDRLSEEIDLLCRCGVEDIAVLDPIFNVGPEAHRVLERFSSRGFTGRLSLQCRAESLSADFLALAAGLDVRLELGLQTIHEAEGTAIDRRNHIGRVDDALARLRRLSIAHEVSLIYGLPEQTLASFEASIDWCLRRRVPVLKAFPLMLLRGTKLERERKRWSLEEDGAVMPMVVASSSFDRHEHHRMACLAEALARTEGRHPSGIDELRRIASGLEVTRGRWQPAAE